MGNIKHLVDEEDKIKTGIKEAMNLLVIDRMPTSKELRAHGMTWLDSLINKHGGLIFWANKLELNHKSNIVRLNDNEAKNLILKVIKELGLNRMPSNSEIHKVFGNYRLHNYIVRHGGYRKFAEEMDLKLKASETQLGQDFELIIENIINNKGFDTLRMSTGHPFDLLINNVVKVDVKVSRPHMKDKYRVHTFGINKKYGSCDIYLAIALDENDNIEKFLVIPSHHLRITTLCIGVNSKYDTYNNRFDYIEKYIDFFKSI